jgi:hypothetical protein
MTGSVVDDDNGSTYTAMLVPDEPSVVILQEHTGGRLRTVLWIHPKAAVELGKLLIEIATDEYDPIGEMM